MGFCQTHSTQKMVQSDFRWSSASAWSAWCTARFPPPLACTASSTLWMRSRRFRVTSTWGNGTFRMSQVFLRGGLAISSTIGVIAISSKWAVNSTSKFSLATISLFPAIPSHLTILSWLTIQTLNSSLLPYLHYPTTYLTEIVLYGSHRGYTVASVYRRIAFSGFQLPSSGVLPQMYTTSPNWV